MSEWLGKPKRTVDDMSPYWRTKPFLAKSFEELQMLRISLVLPYDIAEEFVEAVDRKYGKFTGKTVKEASLEAILEWMKKQKDLRVK